MPFHLGQEMEARRSKLEGLKEIRRGGRFTGNQKQPDPIDYGHQDLPRRRKHEKFGAYSLIQSKNKEKARAKSFPQAIKIP